ncbi:hypothetical protein SAMN05660964_01514 [Thiothrix caldifontis]|uniref:Uncharacterized protein n=1 Tax=Thiothrix caldifontis TaxID=525918 RepID=A0A1H4AXB2_9GAMM|nr:hypothetical protein [Thiothrix caldifontis]SEA40486.1 hypothetical protein SAMN05660964_01514 [Thiothrix caldifontis]
MKTLSLLVFCLATLGACTPPTDTAATVRATVHGTTAQPDPVETKIRSLERAGQLNVLSVRESFPPQFELEGAAPAIAEVQALSGTK